MPKGKDPFDTFRAATLSNSSLSDAIGSAHEDSPAAVKENKIPDTPKVQVKAPDKKNEKPALEQVSFFLDKDLKKAVGLLKYELDVQLKDLYEEAIRDLLKKYHKL